MNRTQARKKSFMSCMCEGEECALQRDALLVYTAVHPAYQVVLRSYPLHCSLRLHFRPIFLSPCGRVGGLGAQEERILCVCGGAGRGAGGGEGGVMMLDCDRCHRWFHGHCVGITSQEVRRKISRSLFRFPWDNSWTVCCPVFVSFFFSFSSTQAFVVPLRHQCLPNRVSPFLPRSLRPAVTHVRACVSCFVDCSFFFFFFCFFCFRVLFLIAPDSIIHL